MKRLKWIIIGFVLLLIVAGTIVYLNLNSIVRSAIESQSTESLKLTTTLESARLSLLGGRLNLGNLRIASPKGYVADHMLTLDEGAIAVSYGQLRADPIHISELTLDHPKFVVEQVGGRFNFQAMLDLPPSPEPVKLIIDKLTVKDATVVLRPGIPGLDASMTEIVIPVPTMTLEKIGTGDGSQNGAAIKQVVAQMLAALVEKSGQAGNISEQLRGALQAGARSVTDRVRTELVGELDKRLKGVGVDGVGKQLGGELDKMLGGAADQKNTKDKKQPPK